jgi:propionate CoA-transferase
MREVAVLDADAAVARIADGATIAFPGSGGGLLETDVLFAATERRFLDTGRPRDLRLVHALGIGDGSVKGMNHFAHEGMIRCVVAGHWSWSPEMQRLVKENRIEAHAWPTGMVSTMLRESGAGRPGVITRTGLGTFVDPRHGGGRGNERTTEPLVELIEFNGREHLWYRPIPVDVAFVRASAADRFGNLSLAEEPAQLDTLAVAQAAKANGGLVIAQAKRLVPGGSLDPRLVHVPGMLVDVVVEAPGQWQTYETEYDPGLSGAERTPADPPPPPRDVAKRILAGRAAMEVEPGNMVGVGFGASSEAVGILAASGVLDEITIGVEQGLIGGIPVRGQLFGMSRNPMAVIPMTAMFDTISGRGLDVAILGMAQIDRTGAVNVSHIGGLLVGPGGFVDISQAARKAVFCGTFTARGLAVDVADGALVIHSEGSIRKLVHDVDAITYSGSQAVADGRRAVYVTERAVFELTAEGVELTEIAPGVDIERDILPNMGFEPIVRAPRPMPTHLFESTTAAIPSGGPV